MENQHRKIKGYRELTEYEIELMNRIKEKGAELMALQQEVFDHVVLELRTAVDVGNSEVVNRHRVTEPQRWANIGKTDIQTGIMALVRSVAQPEI